MGLSGEKQSREREQLVQRSSGGSWSGISKEEKDAVMAGIE